MKEDRSITKANTVSVASTSTALTRELADMMQILPIKGAASILMMVFDTIDEVQVNKNECRRLAERSLTLLQDICTQMQDRRDDAPPSLIRNLDRLEQVLASIHTFMKRQEKDTWASRFLHKNEIDLNIVDLKADLEDAARAFQIATLINIHHAVARKETKDSDVPPAYDEVQRAITQVHPGGVVNTSGLESDALRKTSAQGPHNSTRSATSEATIISRVPSCSASDDFVLVTPPEDCPVTSQDVSVANQASPPTAADVEASSNTSAMIKSELPRHHQSQVRILGRSRIKEGWWAGCVDADLGGTKVTLKRYEGEGAKQIWEDDIHILTHVSHDCLPRLLGTSFEDSVNPFILLEHADTKSVSVWCRDRLRQCGAATCADAFVSFYLNIQDLALHLEATLQLPRSKTQDYVERASYRITAEDRVMVGLPSMEAHHMLSARQWDLGESIRRAIRNSMLPAFETDGMSQQKVSEALDVVASQAATARLLVESS